MYQSFNTSHVVIYPKYNFSSLYRLVFQYISCCYLSRMFCTSGIFLLCVSIHLMLLFIYTDSVWRQWQTNVSIHLMLLFISEDTVSSNGIESFQYISCCYLSVALFDNIFIPHLFQYISCCYLSNL